MNKPHGIIVFGANGSGKTTLGRELAHLLNFKYMDHEDYHFEISDIPYSVERSREDCLNLMLADIEKHRSFVLTAVTGNFGDTIPKFYELAVFISAPIEVRMERIDQRAYKRYGKRIRKGGDMYEQHLEFVNFARLRNLSNIDKWAETLTCRVIHIDGTEDWRANVTNIVERFYKNGTFIQSTSETDKERQARIYPVILSEYNPAWPEWFAEEKKNLKRLIGAENIVRISHIGSTAVPGLMAKPTVDIQLDIKENVDIEKLVALFARSDYICLYPPNIPTPPPHLTVLKGYAATGFAEKVFHIHFRYPGDDDRLIFRDYLIAHPETATEYAVLKLKLKNEFEHNRDSYTYAKSEFVSDVMKKAREGVSI